VGARDVDDVGGSSRPPERAAATGNETREILAIVTSIGL
jgi:hypothetical protein